MQSTTVCLFAGAQERALNKQPYAPCAGVMRLQNKSYIHPMKLRPLPTRSLRELYTNVAKLQVDSIHKNAMTLKRELA